MNNNLFHINDPFFLVYDSRSGSTFLANLLVKSLKVSIPPETNFITAILGKYRQKNINNYAEFDRVIEIIYSDRKFHDWQLEPGEIKNFIQPKFPLTIRDLILKICTLYKNKNHPNAQIFGLKKGVYLDRHQQMKALFPQAKYIGIVRDGRAVFNSKKHSLYSVTGQPFETDPVKAAQEWCRVCHLLAEVEHKYPSEVLKIQYEDMIHQPENVVLAVQDFLDVSPDKQVKAKSYIVPQRYDKLHENINKKPLKERINAWQQSLSPAEIYAFESVAYKCLKSENYQLINSSLPKKGLQQKINTFVSYVRTYLINR